MSVSVKDVAALAGVSVGTVSNVLNRSEKVAPATVERVQAAIEKLGFVRNDVARQLRAGRSRTIGFVVLDVGNPFFADLARGAEESASEAGFVVTLGNSGGSIARELDYLELFEEQRVLGVLISPVDDVSARLARLRSRGIPAVLVDRAAKVEEVSSVSVDDVAGGRLAVEHLISLGRKRIAFVGGALEVRQVADRLAGALEAVAEHPDVRLEVIETDAQTVLQGRAAGELIGARPPADRPDAIFAANDLLAMGALQALTMIGSVSVPGDIALIGYDDIDFAAAAVVPLSSIRQPSLLIGKTAVEILLEEAEDDTLAPRQILFSPELVVRESTGV